ncbi:TlyA family RNA methyltransferase [Chlamydiota bacterium]
MQDKKKRLDLLLVELGLVSSREKAKRLILAGQVFVNGTVVSKTAVETAIESLIQIKKQERFVSRGGEKLAFALEEFSLSSDGLIILDIGASTGGFTDCLLQQGAQKVYSVDVGYGQLDWRLRNNRKVVVIERKNARYLTIFDIGELVDIITIDVSFISLTKIIPAAINILKDRGVILALIKPQFEAARTDISKGGVVKKEEIRIGVLERIKEFSRSHQLTVKGICRSPLVGPAGNIEYFIYLQK